MSSLWIVVIGVVVIYAAYTLYARRIDRTVIASDPNKSTPARMYMDGADFMPTIRFVLYGYRFKSIAAAVPIVGVISAASLWRWLPSLRLLRIGAMALGPLGATFETGKAPNWSTAPIAGAVNSFNTSINAGPLWTTVDPTNADPRIPAPGADGKRPTAPAYNAASGEINILPSFLLASLLL